MNLDFNFKLHFITFGAGRFQNAVSRILEQAKKVTYPYSERPLFESFTGLNDKDLPENFSTQNPDHSPLTNPKNARGYGYWLWKPFILLQHIQKIPEGEFLVYFDSGFELFKNDSWLTYLNEIEYFDVLLQNNDNVVNGNYLARSGIPWYTNLNWTKGDIFEHFGVSLTDPFGLRAQAQSGFLILRNCPGVQNLLQEWFETMAIYRLVSDLPSLTPNAPTFVENRHDQSLLNFVLFKPLNKERKLRIHVFPLLSQPYHSKMAFFSARNSNSVTCIR